jgi:hypothetical protein
MMFLIFTKGLSDLIAALISIFLLGRTMTIAIVEQLESLINSKKNIIDELVNGHDQEGNYDERDFQLIKEYRPLLQGIARIIESESNGFAATLSFVLNKFQTAKSLYFLKQKDVNRDNWIKSKVEVALVLCAAHHLLPTEQQSKIANYVSAQLSAGRAGLMATDILHISKLAETLNRGKLLFAEANPASITASFFARPSFSRLVDAATSMVVGCFSQNRHNP